MKVFIIGANWDTGGQGIRIKHAFDRYAPGWSVRAMHGSKLFFNYPVDLPFDLQQAQHFYDEADVVHLRNGIKLYERLDRGQCKPVVVHHHGTALRSHPQKARDAAAIGAVQLVSTIDLLDDAPSAMWLPAPYDLDWIRDKYRAPKKGRMIRIGHAPTNRTAKGTAEILKALDTVSMWHQNVEVDLIENVEWRVCLSRKGRCDIFIDQLTLGYGNNAVEAMAMSIPVVSGWQDPADRVRFMEATGVRPPFVEATAKTLADQLDLLIQSASLREEWGMVGRKFAEQFHAEHHIVERLKTVYATAPRSKASRSISVTPQNVHAPAYPCPMGPCPVATVCTPQHRSNVQTILARPLEKVAG